MVILTAGALYYTHQSHAPATATIDQNSLTPISATPTISGSVSNWNPNTTTIRIQISSQGEIIYESGLYGVSNNRWSISVVPTLSPGTYSISVLDNNNNLLTSGIFTIVTQW